MVQLILVLQLLLMPFAWASPPSTVGSDDQLCGHEASLPCAQGIGRDREERGTSANSVRPLAPVLLCDLAPKWKLSFSGLHALRVPSVFLTYPVVAILHRHKFIPPPIFA